MNHNDEFAPAMSQCIISPSKEHRPSGDGRIFSTIKVRYCAVPVEFHFGRMQPISSFRQFPNACLQHEQPIRNFS